jgi:hypothetical protein
MILAGILNSLLGRLSIARDTPGIIMRTHPAAGVWTSGVLLKAPVSFWRLAKPTAGTRTVALWPERR